MILEYFRIISIKNNQYSLYCWEFATWIVCLWSGLLLSFWSYKEISSTQWRFSLAIWNFILHSNILNLPQIDYCFALSVCIFFHNCYQLYFFKKYFMTNKKSKVFTLFLTYTFFSILSTVLRNAILIFFITLGYEVRLVTGGL